MKCAKPLIALLCIACPAAWAAEAHVRRPPVPGVAANLPSDVTTATVLSPEPAPTAPKGWRPTPRIGIPATQRVVPPPKTASTPGPSR
jgi:hypothetical protein